MSRSIQEEIVAVLWLILAAILTIGHFPQWIAFFCAAKGSYDLGHSVHYAIRESRAQKHARTLNEAKRERRLNGTAQGQ